MAGKFTVEDLTEAALHAKRSGKPLDFEAKDSPRLLEAMKELNEEAAQSFGEKFWKQFDEESLTVLRGGLNLDEFKQSIEEAYANNDDAKAGELVAALVDKTRHAEHSFHKELGETVDNHVGVHLTLADAVLRLAEGTADPYDDANADEAAVEAARATEESLNEAMNMAVEVRAELEAVKRLLADMGDLSPDLRDAANDLDAQISDVQSVVAEINRAIASGQAINVSNVRNSITRLQNSTTTIVDNAQTASATNYGVGKAEMFTDHSAAWDAYLDTEAKRGAMMREMMMQTQFYADMDSFLNATMPEFKQLDEDVKADVAIAYLDIIQENDKAAENHLINKVLTPEQREEAQEIIKNDWTNIRSYLKDKSAPSETKDTIREILLAHGHYLNPEMVDVIERLQNGEEVSASEISELKEKGQQQVKQMTSMAYNSLDAVHPLLRDAIARKAEEDGISVEEYLAKNRMSQEQSISILKDLKRDENGRVDVLNMNPEERLSYAQAQADMMYHTLQSNQQMASYTLEYMQELELTVEQKAELEKIMSASPEQRQEMLLQADEKLQEVIRFQEAEPSERVDILIQKGKLPEDQRDAAIFAYRSFEEIKVRVPEEKRAGLEQNLQSLMTETLTRRPDESENQHRLRIQGAARAMEKDYGLPTGSINSYMDPENQIARMELSRNTKSDAEYAIKVAELNAEADANIDVDLVYLRDAQAIRHIALNDSRATSGIPEVQQAFWKQTSDKVFAQAVENGMSVEAALELTRSTVHELEQPDKYIPSSETLMSAAKTDAERHAANEVQILAGQELSPIAVDTGLAGGTDEFGVSGTTQTDKQGIATLYENEQYAKIYQQDPQRYATAVKGTAEYDIAQGAREHMIMQQTSALRNDSSLPNLSYEQRRALAAKQTDTEIASQAIGNPERLAAAGWKDSAIRTAIADKNADQLTGLNVAQRNAFIDAQLAAVKANAAAYADPAAREQAQALQNAESKANTANLLEETYKDALKKLEQDPTNEWALGRVQSYHTQKAEEQFVAQNPDHKGVKNGTVALNEAGDDIIEQAEAEGRRAAAYAQYGASRNAAPKIGGQSPAGQTGASVSVTSDFVGTVGVTNVVGAAANDDLSEKARAEAARLAKEEAARIAREEARKVAEEAARKAAAETAAAEKAAAEKAAAKTPEAQAKEAAAPAKAAGTQGPPPAETTQTAEATPPAPTPNALPPQPQNQAI